VNHDWLWIDTQAVDMWATLRWLRVAHISTASTTTAQLDERSGRSGKVII
jgi:hypothetical protein